MPATWVGIAETTIRDYLRDVEVDVVRNRKVPALLQAKDRLEYNHSGTDIEWKLRYKRGYMRGYADMDVVSFVRRNRWKSASLSWRGYSLDESLSIMDTLINRGTPAIVKLLADKLDVMIEDVEDQFGDKFYLDGSATGNEKEIHGIESFMGTSGSSTSTGPVQKPSDTYAGLNTDLGNYGGTWSGNTDWPKGTGSAEYDFYSPLLVDYTSSLATASGGFSQATATWAARAPEAIRYGITHCRKNSTKKGMIDMVLVDSEMYRLFVEKLATNEHVNIQQGGGGKGDTLTGLGWSDTVNFEGAEVTAEYGIPQGSGYGWNLDMVTLMSLQETLFKSRGPIFNESDKSFRFSVDFFGNLKFRSPRYFFKLKAYGGS